MRAQLQQLRQAYKLLNHGPTTLISSAANGARNVMAASWVVPLDFEPPKIAAVIASGTHTRKLIDLSQEFVVSVPLGDQVELTYAVGSCSGAEVDKFEKFHISVSAGAKSAAPLIDGCAAWLECKVIDERAIQESYDLFIAEVVAAWFDDSLLVDGEWRFTAPLRRTIHHLGDGKFFGTGERIDVPSDK